MSPEGWKSVYRRLIGVGETVIIRRYTGAGANRPKYDAPVRGRVMAYEPRELVGSIVQGDQKLVILAEDLIAAQVALPLVKGDKAVVRGKELNIEAPDANTRRVAGVLTAYDLQVRG